MKRAALLLIMLLNGCSHYQEDIAVAALAGAVLGGSTAYFTSDYRHDYHHGHHYSYHAIPYYHPSQYKPASLHYGKKDYGRVTHNPYETWSNGFL